MVSDSNAVHRSFVAEASAVPEVRRFTIEALRPCLEPGTDLTGDVQLVVSELATNAVRHAGSGFTVRLTCDGDVVRVAVVDPGSEHPAQIDPDRSTVGGRGLRIVELLADRWGVENLGVGKSIWAEFRLA